MSSLKELAQVFFKIGTTAFGGPAAHIAMMEEEVVRRRQWLSQQEFLDAMAVCQLIPGPNSTELAIHVGYKMARWRGLVTAGVCFILPAFCIVWFLAWAYVRYGSLPEVQPVLHTIQPVILAVIAQAIWGLSRTALKNKVLILLSLVAFGLYFLKVHELVTLFGIALAYFLFKLKNVPGTLVSAGLAAPMVVSTGISSVSTPGLFLFFLKVGSVLFGSGYVLVAFLQRDLVEKLGWLNQIQLLDAIAVGQITPGPVFTTATFIGYLLAGSTGAIVATTGIFLPAFVFVALSAPFIPKLRHSRKASVFLDGLNAASLSLMAGASLQIAAPVFQGVLPGFLFLINLFLLIKYKINSAFLVLGAGLLGLLL